MIFFLYGKNDIKIREEIDKIKSSQNYNEVIRLSAEEIEIDKFAESITNPSLFGHKILVILESYAGKNEDLLTYVKVSRKASPKTDIAMALHKDLRENSKILKEIKAVKSEKPEFTTRSGTISARAKIIKPKEEKNSKIFDFIDSVYSKNRARSYSLLEEISGDGEEIFRIHSLLMYQLRNLLRAKHSAKTTVPPFVKRKLARQAGNFSEKRLLELCSFIYHKDIEMKTGKIPHNILNTVIIEEILGEE